VEYVYFALVLVGPLSALWVFLDCSKNESRRSALFWTIFVLLFWIIAFPLYLLTRDERSAKQAQLDPNIVMEHLKESGATKACPECKAALSVEARMCHFCGLSLENEPQEKS